MSKFITLTRNPRTGEYSFPSVPKQKRIRSGASAECPAWLLTKYRRFKVFYLFDNTSDWPADLETVKRLPTGEWAAVYMNRVHLLADRDHGWTEWYTWLWRGGEMVELSQKGARPSKGKRRRVAGTMFK